MGKDAKLIKGISTKKRLISLAFIFTTLGLLVGTFFVAIVNFDFIPSWYKLPLVPSEPTKITNVELGNIFIKTDDNKIYRCKAGSNECWTENLELTIPSWWDNNGWERYYREYESCDYSKPYFLTWRFSSKEIIDCVDENEAFVDWGVNTVVLIDQNGNVWQHTYSFSAIASNTAILICPIFGTIGGLILGVCIMALRTILQKVKRQKAESQ